MRRSSIRRVTISSLVAAAALALTTGAGATSSTSHPKLFGTVGKNDAFIITLKTANGKLVRTLPAGTYTFVIHDYSSLHAFNMDGPHGWSHDLTTVPAVTSKPVTLKLKAGKYKYYCVAHESTMFHWFTVK